MLTNIVSYYKFSLLFAWSANKDYYYYLLKEEIIKKIHNNTINKNTTITRVKSIYKLSISIAGAVSLKLSRCIVASMSKEN